MVRGQIKKPPAANQRKITMANTQNSYSKYKVEPKHYHSERGERPRIKVPVDINILSKKDFALYITFLDMKMQAPEVGTFEIQHSKRYYQRMVKKLIAKGWAWREKRKIYLKSYHHVWRQLKFPKTKVNGHYKVRVWCLWTDKFISDKLKEYEPGTRKVIGGYLKEMTDAIRKLMAQRKRKQIRFAKVRKIKNGKACGDWVLKDRSLDTTVATFSASQASRLFGYRSPQSGAKLREQYFEVTKDERYKRLYWNKERGRYEFPTKYIEL